MLIQIIGCIIKGQSDLVCSFPALTSDQNDFTPITNHVVTFQAGETEQPVEFTSLSDNIAEGTEMLTAVLSNRSARTMIGPQNTAMINITDDAGKLSRFLHCKTLELLRIVVINRV